MEQQRKHPRVRAPESGPSMTKQSDALDSDINAIMGRFISHGEIPASRGQPQYGDFSNVDDYLGAMTKVREAQAQFDLLPAAVRAHVDNDPGKFLEMVYDEDRIGELEELGLVERQKPEPIADPAKVAKEMPKAPAEPAVEPPIPAE